MSDDLRTMGATLARPMSPMPDLDAAGPSVRFSHPAEGSPTVRRVGSGKDGKRPMSWAFDSKAFATLHRKPVPSSGDEATTAHGPTPPVPPLQAGAPKARRNSLESAPKGLMGVTPAPDMVGKLAYQAGPYALPPEKHFLGKAILTSEHRLFIQNIRNQAIFLAKQNSSLEARLKTAEESIKNHERHTANFDRTLRSAQEESIFYQRFYESYVQKIDRLHDLFEESKRAATQSRKAAMEGLDIIGDFPLMPGQLDDASSSASSASVSDAASVRATFGRVRVD
jgi:hypothetical protein